MPVVCAEIGRNHQGTGPAGAGSGRDDRATGRVDPGGPVQRGEGPGRDQLPGFPVDHIEEGVLVGLHQDMPGSALDRQIGQHDRLRRVVVPAVARRGLIVPDLLTGTGPERHDRRGVEIVPGRRPAEFRIPRRGIAGADVHQIERGIVDDRIPRTSAAPALPPLARPGRSRFAHRVRFERKRRIAGHHIGPPGHRPGPGIVSRDVPSDGVLRAGVTDQHAAPSDSGRAGDGVGFSQRGRLHAPRGLSGLLVDRDQPSVDGADVDSAAIEGHAAVHHIATDELAVLLGHVRIIAPEHGASAGIHRVDHAPGAAGIENAILHQGGRLESVEGPEVDRPGQAEPVDALLVDLAERAEALLGVGPSVTQPIGGIGVGGRQRVVVDLPAGPAGEQQGDTDSGDREGTPKRSRVRQRHRAAPYFVGDFLATGRLPIRVRSAADCQSRKPPTKALALSPRRACGGTALSLRELPPPSTT